MKNKTLTEHEHQASDARSGDRPGPETTDLPVYGLLYMLTEAAERSLVGCIQHKWQFSGICPICLSIRDDLKAAVARVTEALR